MPRIYLLLASLIFITINTRAQVNYSANDKVTPWKGDFSPGMNPGYYGGKWNDFLLTDVAVGNAAAKTNGVGVRAFRTSLPENIALIYDYSTWEKYYAYYKAMGLKNNTVIVGFAHPDHADPKEYCEGKPTEMFANLYEPIFDGGLNGTPVNENNYFARYMWNLLETIGDQVTFWEIWNEPGFDFTGAKGWFEKGQDGNWWENNPDPCDYKLRAPIFHYVRTLRIAYEVVKTHSPGDYIVLSGVGSESFLDAVLRNSDNPSDGKISSGFPLKGGAYFDVMGFHSVPHFDGSMRKWDNRTGGFVYNRHSDQGVEGFLEKKSIRAKHLAEYGYDGNKFPTKEWMITEFNVPKAAFPDASAPKINYFGSEDGARNFIMKSVVSAMQEGLIQIHPYQLAERQPVEKATGSYDRMGFFKNFNNSLPYEIQIYEQGIGYKTTTDILFGKKYDPDRTKELELPRNVKGGAFKNRKGEFTYVLWGRTNMDNSEVAKEEYSFPKVLNLGKVEKRTWEFSESKRVEVIEGQNITLDGTPAFFAPVSKVPSTEITMTCAVDSTAIRLATSLDKGGIKYSWNYPSAKTSCTKGGVVVTQIEGLENGSFFPIGYHIIVYKVTDACGNEEKCGFTIHVTSKEGGAGNTSTGCHISREGFQYIGNFGGHKYFVSKIKMTYTEGMEMAKKQGGFLAAINSENENKYLGTWNHQQAIIGYNDMKEEGIETWGSGESVTYTNFEDANCTWCESNNEKNDVVEFHPWNGKWSWINATEKRNVIIEIPCFEKLGCDCPTKEESVCGADGKTYLNACAAECAGVFNYLNGDCDETPKEEDCSGEIDGFIALGKFGESKYYLSNKISRPTDAQKNAKSHGGYLVSISSKEENDFIQRNISEMTYIGLNDTKAEGKLVWRNGEALSFDNIKPCKDCNKNSTEMNFVIIAPWDGTWSFSNFYNNRKYIMEIPCKKN